MIYSVPKINLQSSVNFFFNHPVSEEEGENPTVSINLFYTLIFQIDLMGHSIYDYAHPCDHEEISDHLSTRHLTAPSTCHIKSKGGGALTQPTTPRHHHDFLIRMKCTLTPRGKKVNLKSAVYKVWLVWLVGNIMVASTF